MKKMMVWALLAAGGLAVTMMFIGVFQNELGATIRSLEPGWSQRLTWLPRHASLYTHAVTLALLVPLVFGLESFCRRYNIRYRKLDHGIYVVLWVVLLVATENRYLMALRELLI